MVLDRLFHIIDFLLLNPEGELSCSTDQFDYYNMSIGLSFQLVYACAYFTVISGRKSIVGSIQAAKLAHGEPAITKRTKARSAEIHCHIGNAIDVLSPPSRLPDL